MTEVNKKVKKNEKKGKKKASSQKKSRCRHSENSISNLANRNQIWIVITLFRSI